MTDQNLFYFFKSDLIQKDEGLFEMCLSCRNPLSKSVQLSRAFLHGVWRDFDEIAADITILIASVLVQMVQHDDHVMQRVNVEIVIGKVHREFPVGKLVYAERPLPTIPLYNDTKMP